jgi:uncharacterized membrane protein YbjE (DUF340 family)
MFTFIVPLVTGILLGYIFRGKIRIKLSGVTFWLIIILIFALGFGIGSNNELLNSMPKVGLKAFALSSLAILFSVLFVKIARKMVRIE